jgi:nicotinate-nucleotide adenylyltransferase
VERIGIFGGTFDPVHIGHLVAAIWCRDTLELDEVLLVVANEPWQKVSRREISSAHDRFAVVEAAVEGIDGLEASRMEIDRGGASYTADTVHELLSREPGAELFLVVGSDVAAGLATWQRLDEVEGLVTLVVVERAGGDGPAAPGGETAGRLEVRAPGAEPTARGGPWTEFPGRWGWTGQVRQVRMPRLEISSSELRERISAGRSVDFLIPEPAIRLIRELGLYSVSR